ncbi:hypothetical protein [Thalassomonas haliotis]|uniref:Uncharacterized protein n=1 Tax=Thalassomonas haliotis TaxID=485448 RepID=A0ABY7VF71_9GAMM|nr:hypothetical protein [Thalassomonas haliotis]WDE12037.1 hypothetical protein H3N35_00655 [Thalassomonas haliotis]
MKKYRLQIKGFRTHLLYAGERMLTEEPEIECHFRRALGIPVHIELLPAKLQKFTQLLLGMLPTSVAMNRAKKLLQPVRTSQGREFIFKQQIKRMLLISQMTDSLDFALRHLKPPGKHENFRYIASVRLDWVKAWHHLGVCDLDKMAALIRGHHQYDYGDLALALVKRQVISTPEMLKALPARSHHYNYQDKLTAGDLLRFHQVVQLLLAAGVFPEKIMQLTLYRVEKFDAQRLNATLAFLALDGKKLSVLFDKVAEELLLADTKRWQFLVETLNVKSVHAMNGFKPLLKSQRAPCETFALALLKGGASEQELKDCQELLLAIGEHKGPPPLAALKQLTEPPHNISLAQLPQAREYLLSPDDLPAFLRVLDKHGYGDAQSVLAFLRCYSLHVKTLDSWLGIIGPHGKEQSKDAVAAWTLNAGKSGYPDSFYYLIDAGLIHSFTHLQQALKLTPLGVFLLQYLVERRALTTIDAILHWYYKNAVGIGEIRFLSELDPLQQVILDDAFERKDFTLFHGNCECVRKLVTKRVDETLGPYPYKANEKTRNLYQKKREVLSKQLQVKLSGKLKILLEKTDGLLLESLVAEIDKSERELQMKIDDLSPHLNRLLNGAGPSGDALTTFEADLIAMVYRTTPSTVLEFWPKVRGREEDIAHLTEPADYSMHWQQNQIRLDKPLDHLGLRALISAVEFAERFEKLYQTDMYHACKHLSPKRLNAPAADIWSLARHLGVLLVVAQNTTFARELIGRGDNFQHMAENERLAYKQIESLHALFSVNLPDALDACQADFIEALTNTDASILASRLSLDAAIDSTTAKENLAQGLALARQRINSLFYQWVDRQKKLFVLDGGNNLNAKTKLKAVISKSPAAFFAKKGANICTAANTEMWYEQRHSHLLAFIPGQKHLAAMALLYFEHITALNTSKPTLIIRAINPLANALAMHSASSIVEGFFDVARKIAQDNNMAAVAFPRPNGMHLMSNHDDLERYIKQTYVERAHHFYPAHYLKATNKEAELPCKVDAKFYAYETGKTPVEQLYVVWLNDTQTP